jgi:sugar transferase (PEP-CTERM system associated)
MLKVLRHFLVVPVSLLAIAETALFLAVITGLQIVGARSFLEANAPDTSSPWMVLFLTGLTFVCLAAAGLYNRDVFLEARTFFQRAGVALLLVIFSSLVAFPIYGLLDPVTVEWYLGLLSFSLLIHYPLMIVLRFGLVAFSDASLFKRRIIVVGDGVLSAKVRDLIENRGRAHLSSAGFINRDTFSELAKKNEPVSDLGDLHNSTFGQDSALLRFAKDNKVDEIVVASRERRGLPVWQLLQCRMAGVAVTDYMTFWERESGEIDIDEVKPSWLAMSEGFDAHSVRRVVKRSFDVIVSILFLALVSPVMVLAAAAIKLETPGPVFYRQTRVGKNGRDFQIIKFRSMADDAEQGGVPQWAVKNDCRVTRIGAIIRKLRIDEMPQVLNVLMGEMSFIGPRPERPYFVDTLCAEIPLYAVRHNVKPGITGWAQVNYPYGASIDDARRKLAFDLYYVKNENLFLDVIILLQTVRVVIMLAGSR